MYEEMMQQPQSLLDTLKAEKSHLIEIADKFKEFERIYLVGCGSSLSTCYSVKDALGILSDKVVEVYTGYEFYYHKNLENEDAGVILTSQSGETADTLAALRRSKEQGLYTVSITNEIESTMMKEADDTVITRCGKETAILGTKTYMTQLLSLYQILFRLDDSHEFHVVINDLNKLPKISQSIIKDTEEANRIHADKFKDFDFYYCIGSGPNYGLAYKLAMTMFMEGALKNACPLYRHGLIERAEENVPLIFLDANYPGDELTQKSLDFSEKIGANSLIYKMQDYSDLNSLLSPFILVIPLEWFIYYLAHYNGEDPGSTRHIGKVRY
jgi:glucosamine--fructose-6-phosphate aminotransferase (isomerizing)